MIETWTVGGVIGGYWAIGSDNSAIAPASVMTIDRTVAKIGRSMKKREITAIIPSPIGEVAGGEGVLAGAISLPRPAPGPLARAWVSLPFPLPSAAAPVAGR